MLPTRGHQVDKSQRNRDAHHDQGNRKWNILLEDSCDKDANRGCRKCSHALGHFPGFDFDMQWDFMLAGLKREGDFVIDQLT